MKYKNICFPLLLLLSGVCATAQTVVGDYQPGLTKEGITYFLPVTAFHIVVTAEKTHFEPGELAVYAAHFLRTSGATLEAHDRWTLKNIRLQVYGEADKGEAYTIKLKSKTSAPFVALSPDGCLLSVNGTAPKLPALIPPGFGKETPADGEPPLNPDAFKTPEMLAAGSKQKMAELAANEIYDIRDSRSALSKGQADYMPKDGEQLKLMMNNLNRQEKGLMQLFLGTSTVQEQTFVFDCVPSDSDSQTILCRFSKYFGVLPKDNLAGAPVYLTIKNLNALPEEEYSRKKKGEKDLRYCVPGKAEVSISCNNHYYLKEHVSLAQIGRIEHLGGELFNKKHNIHVQLSPSTGGIYKIDDASLIR